MVRNYPASCDEDGSPLSGVRRSCPENSSSGRPGTQPEHSACFESPAHSAPLHPVLYQVTTGTLVTVVLLLGKVCRSVLVFRLRPFRLRRILLRFIAEQGRGDLCGGVSELLESVGAKNGPHGRGDGAFAPPQRLTLVGGDFRAQIAIPLQSDEQMPTAFGLATFLATRPPAVVNRI